ncbi:MAG: hypothetical protein HYW27_04185 [Candidatus Aenigmarchaeota archaeon]|nr:hypothetical protein [Candidatus Aenigmarchaeota archaeon]
MQSVMNGVGIGFFSAFFISLYLDSFIGVVIPIAITYFIIAPLVSAVSILLILYSKKDEKRKSGIEWWEESEALKKQL